MAQTVVERVLGVGAVGRLGGGRGGVRGPSSTVVWETVYLHDYDADNKNGQTHRRQMPLSVLEAHASTSARYAYPTHRFRKVGLICGGFIGGLVVSGLLYPLLSYMAPIIGMLLGVIPGALGGWYLAPRFAPRPIWCFRRIWDPPETVIAQAPPENVFRTADGHCRIVVPVPYSYLADVLPPMEKSSSGKGNGATASESDGQAAGQSLSRMGIPFGPSAQRPPPVMRRARAMYEMLMQRTARKLARKRKMDTWHKMAIGSLVVLAVASVVMMIFLFIVATDIKVDTQNKEAAAWLSGAYHQRM